MSNGLSLVQLKQLRELHWLEDSYNILFAGPSGVGKTFIAAGLCHDAIRRGYRGVFRSMESIIATIKRKDISSAAKKEYKTLTEAQVIVIDDIMNVAVDRDEGNMLFAFINSVYKTTSFIITTNKSPVEWARTLPDEVLGAVLLDRLLYKCELIQLSGDSYRMKHRKTIFENKSTTTNNQTEK
ncbi:MAG: ATP-binding protein [Bacteroidota bacterium]|nr:ATP-binding protein [Bacteroidota bacterium]